MSQKKKPTGGKLRGHPRDAEDVRVSKTLSWILRHGAQGEGLAMRPDGYVRVKDLLANPKLRSVDFLTLERLVQADEKSRYHLMLEPAGVVEGSSSGAENWWIRANQGHSLKSIQLDLNPILSAADVPMAVHGTNMHAWTSISTQGLSRMRRNHIHLAQGLSGDGVVSGMRSSSQVLIYIDLQKALDAGIKFFLSANGVVLTEGDENGILPPIYFSRVERANHQAIEGWDVPVPLHTEGAGVEASTPQIRDSPPHNVLMS